MKKTVKHSLAHYRNQLVFLADIFVMLASGALVLLLSMSGQISDRVTLLTMLWHMMLLIGCTAVSQLFFRTYASLWRYAESREYLALLCGNIVGYAGYFLLALLLRSLFLARVNVLFSLLVCTISMIGEMLYRFLYRHIRSLAMQRQRKQKVKLAIVGAGDAGVSVLTEILRNPKSLYCPICFVDDDPVKIGKYIHGVEVKGPVRRLPELFAAQPVNEIIVAIPSADADRRRAILETCAKLSCSVKILPGTLDILRQNGGQLLHQVRSVKIDDLLSRDPIMFDNNDVKDFLADRVVMVTGGGGSIGSELCRQIAKQAPAQLIIVDIYENNAYDIQQELLSHYGKEFPLKVEIASVRDAQKVDLLFRRYHPEIVFHAAAHKHVPLMENCPEEAIKNNVFGTYNVVHASDRYQVEKFVLISTDKAVNPTNVMGASKRMCEMILQSMKNVSKTSFVAVRFGNVLGSNGSVIPLFKRQIRNGGPVTITDKRIIRYFMTIPEAAQLVLRAGAMAKQSEVFVLDMGKPVKILELAENLIRLSGYTPYVDMPIVETGLRPGEKLYEELLMRSEELTKTTSDLIYIEHQKDIAPEEMEEKLQLLSRSLSSESVDKVRQTMKQVVPTYKSPEEVNGKSVSLDYSNVDHSVVSNREKVTLS